MRGATLGATKQSLRAKNDKRKTLILYNCSSRWDCFVTTNYHSSCGTTRPITFLAMTIRTKRLLRHNKYNPFLRNNTTNNVPRNDNSERWNSKRIIHTWQQTKTTLYFISVWHRSCANGCGNTNIKCIPDHLLQGTMWMSWSITKHILT